MLLSSRELAGQASASIKDFRETFLVFLMDETVSMNTKIDEIKKYQEASTLCNRSGSLFTNRIAL